MSSNAIKVGGGIVVVIALAVGVWLIRPLFVDSVVDEAFPGEAAAGASEFPLSTGAVVPPDMTQEEVEAEMAEAAAMPAVEEVEEMPAGPVAVSTGTFAGADDFHQGEGSATIYDLADGSRVLRLEDFSVTNGPDLHVYLVPIVDGVPVVNDASVDLGSLKGNIGAQNYDIPASVDTSQEWGVVIWCQPFRVAFASAALA